MSVARRNAAAAGEAGRHPGRPDEGDRAGPFRPARHPSAGGRDKPEIGPGDVLLKVHAAAVNPYDWHMVRGDPRIARLMGGSA